MIAPMWNTCMVCDEPTPHRADNANEVQEPSAPAQVSQKENQGAGCRIKARWSKSKGWLDLYDPIGKQWHTITAKGNPQWVYDRLPQTKRR